MRKQKHAHHILIVENPTRFKKYKQTPFDSHQVGDGVVYTVVCADRSDIAEAIKRQRPDLISFNAIIVCEYF
jgi:hypothetical protein